jgi:hypothetical protein
VRFASKAQLPRPRPNPEVKGAAEHRNRGGAARRRLRFGRLFLAAALVLAAGCAGPEARIRRNRAEFERLPAETQAVIREGRIALGFTPEMVRLAVGEPDQRWTRTDAQGRKEIWSYTRFETLAGLPLYRGAYHLAAGGYACYDDGLRGTARAKEYFKVTFAEGRVSIVEEDSR